MPANYALLRAHPAYFLALGFGAGLVPRAPGTVGTLAAFPLYWALVGLPSSAYWLLVGLGFLVGVWACARTAQALDEPDPGSVVWDEIVAFLVVLPFAAAGLWGMLTAFVLFRLFDILKPFPIGWLERRLGGGIGIMLDDLIAAFYAILCLRGIALWI
ncbi:MAG: phosphatidylglycerophosphatase A [Thiobacillaceae bacterium]